ncbi:hypothetical protein V3C99_009558 [Haemonchus contortus]
MSEKTILMTLPTYKSQLKNYESPMISKSLTEFEIVAESKKTLQIWFINSCLVRIRDAKYLKRKGKCQKLDCRDEVVRAFDSICIDNIKHDYALKYVYVLNSL